MLESEPNLQRFIALYSKEPKCRSIRLKLAWLRLEQKRYGEAKALVDAERDEATWTDADWVTVLDGALLRVAGQPLASLERLRSLNGKLTDVTLRELWSIEVIKAAIEASRFDTAIELMVEYRAYGREERIVTTQSQIETWLLRVPDPILSNTLTRLSTLSTQPVVDEGRKQARLFLLEAVRERLAIVALDRKDNRLAQILLQTASPRFKRSETGESLRQLSDSAAPPNESLHAVIGILLEMQDDFSSRRSAEIITGALRALDEEPSATPVRVVSREVRETTDSAVEAGLVALVQDGAAVVIAAVTKATANTVARFGKSGQVAVITLSGSATEPRTTPFVFHVDEASDVISKDFANLERGGFDWITTEHSACTSTTKDEAWTTELSSSRGLFLLTDEICAKKVARTLATRKNPPRVWLGPEAVGAAEQFSHAALVTSPTLSDERSPIVRSWQERFRRKPFFYEALGYDVVRLSRQAILTTSIESVSDARKIAEKRAEIATALGRVQTTLLTSKASGFDSQHRLSPSLVRVSVLPSGAPGASP